MTVGIHLDQDAATKILVGDTADAEASAVVQIDSTTGGALVPRMTGTQRDAISSPAEGLTIWNTDDSEMQVYDGSSWTALGSGGSGDVAGPASSTNHTIPRFQGTTGKILETTGIFVSDQNRITIPDSAAEAPLNIWQKNIVPSSPTANDVYLDDGTNTASGNPGWRRYTGSVWEDISAASGGGGVSIDITVTAGEALAERDIVFIDPSDGEAYKADADATTPLLGRIRGVVNESGGISSAATGSVRIAGEVAGFTGLTAWQPVYAATTAGGYTQTKPNPTDGGGQVAVVPMGYAVSTTAVMVDLKPVQYLKRETLADAATTTITHHADAQGRSRMVRAYVTTDVDTDAASYGSANQDEDVQLRGENGAGGTTSNTTGSSTTTVRSFIGDFNGTEYAPGQSFQLSAAGRITEFTFDLGANVGNPTGDITWQIHADDGTSKPGTVLDSGTHTPTPSATNTVTVTDGPILEASTKYWLTLQAGAQATNARYTWKCDDTGSDTYANGGRTLSSDGGSTWSTENSTEDMVFEVTASAVTSKDKLAQSFQLSAGETVDKVRLWLKKVGSPTGTMTLRIETDSAGEPSGTLADANATVTVAESGLGTSYGWIEFDFGTDFSLSGSTTYWLVLSTDRSASNSDYVVWGADGSTPGYADGEMQSEVAASWSAESKDAVFEVLKPVVLYDEPCVIGRSSGGTRDVGVRFDDGSGSDANTKTTFVNHMGGSADVTCVVELE